MSAAAYIAQTERRFANPAIQDTTHRVAFDGSARHTGFLLPVVRDALAAGAPLSGLALVEALWARMCAGWREDGSVIEPNDPKWDNLQKAARSAQEQPMAWLEQPGIYGELAQSPEFTEPFCQMLAMLWASGTTAVIEGYLND